MVRESAGVSVSDCTFQTNRADGASHLDACRGGLDWFAAVAFVGGSHWTLNTLATARVSEAIWIGFLQLSSIPIEKLIVWV